MKSSNLGCFKAEPLFSINDRFSNLLLYCTNHVKLGADLCKNITKTSPCNEDPFTPPLGFTGVYIFFLFLLQNIDCVPTINVLGKNKKIIKKFHMKMNIFTAVKYCCILHGRVCVMLQENENISLHLK